MRDSPGELSAVVGIGNQRGLGSGILWKASVLDLSHQRTDPAASRQSMTRGCGSGSKSERAGRAPTDPAKGKGSSRRAH